LAVLLGGRAAEKIIFGELSTGATDDLAKVTDIARTMVTRYGMVETLGQVAFEEERDRFLTVPGVPPIPGEKRYSEETAREIDRAVKAFVDEAFARAVKVLSERRPILERGAKLLLQKETLTEAELASLVGLSASPASSAAK
jgi:cell division protease FtsH